MLIAMMDINMSTVVSPGDTQEHWAITASGVIQNKSNRVISQIKVWCRVESLQGQETDSDWISIGNLKPGEGKSFSGEIGGKFYGITESGKTLRVAPRDRFCRVEDIEEA